MISAGYMPATIAMQISIGPIANRPPASLVRYNVKLKTIGAVTQPETGVAGPENSSLKTRLTRQLPCKTPQPGSGRNAAATCAR